MFCLIFLTLWAGDGIVTLDYASLDTQAVQVHDFKEMARIRKVVKLETTPASLLGYVDAVVVGPRGELFVADYYSTHSIKQFAADGAYIRQISRKGDGPGEFRSDPCALCVLPDGKLVVATATQLMRFGKDGRFEREIPLSNTALVFQLAHLGDRLFASNRSPSPKKGNLLRSDANFDLLKFFGPRDQRLDRYLLLPYGNLCAADGELWVSSIYDLELSVYDGLGQLRRRYRFPQTNERDLARVWADKNFDERSRTAIKQKLHRFLNLLRFGDAILAFDFVKQPEARLGMMALSGQKRLQVYTGYHFLNRAYADKTLTFGYLAGNAGTDVIGVLEHDEHFDFLSRTYPEIARARHQSDDNPLLVFVAPSEPRR